MAEADAEKTKKKRKAAGGAARKAEVKTARKAAGAPARKETVRAARKETVKTARKGTVRTARKTAPKTARKPAAKAAGKPAPKTTGKSAAKPAAMSLEDRRALAREVIARLKKEYPDAHCTLDYRDAWQLLVSVRLSAQCTDKRVDETTPLLYAKFPTVAALAAAPVEEIEKIVRPCGLGPSKARDISRCMKVLHEKYHDLVPDNFDELLALPGVGRKSANLVMGDVFGKPAIVTDTHCIRLSNLIGFVDDVREPAKVEKLLWQIIPPEEGSDLCHRLVYHGRAVCVARRPQCGKCCLRDICRFGKTAAAEKDAHGETQNKRRAQRQSGK